MGSSLDTERKRHPDPGCLPGTSERADYIRWLANASIADGRNAGKIGCRAVAAETQQLSAGTNEFYQLVVIPANRGDRKSELIQIFIVISIA
jgi:hypothetical protein